MLRMIAMISAVTLAAGISTASASGIEARGASSATLARASAAFPLEQSKLVMQAGGTGTPLMKERDEKLGSAPHRNHRRW